MKKLILILIFLSFSPTLFADGELLNDMQVEEFCSKVENANNCHFQIDVNRYYIDGYRVHETEWGYFEVKLEYTYDFNAKKLYYSGNPIMDWDFSWKCNYKKYQSSDICMAAGFNFQDSIIDRDNWDKITDPAIKVKYKTLYDAGISIDLDGADIDPNKIFMRVELMIIEFEIEDHKFTDFLVGFDSDATHPVNLDKLINIRFEENIGYSQALIHEDFLKWKLSPSLANNYIMNCHKEGQYFVKNGLTFNISNLTVFDSEGNFWPLINKTTWALPQKDYLLGFNGPISTENAIAHAEKGAIISCLSYTSSYLKLKKSFIDSRVCNSQKVNYTDGTKFYLEGEYYIKKGYTTLDENTLKDTFNNWINLQWDNLSLKTYAVQGTVANCFYVDPAGIQLYLKTYTDSHICSSNTSQLNTNYYLSGSWYVRNNWTYTGGKLNDMVDDWTVEFTIPEIGKKKDKLLPANPIIFSSNINDVYLLISTASTSIKLALFNLEPEMVDKILERKAAQPALNIFAVGDNSKQTDAQYQRLVDAGVNITFDSINNNSVHNSYLVIDDKTTIFMTSSMVTGFRIITVLNHIGMTNQFIEDFNAMKSGKFGINKDVTLQPNWLNILKTNPIIIFSIKCGTFFSPNQHLSVDGLSFFIPDEVPSISGYYKSYLTMLVKPLKASAFNTKEVKVYAHIIKDPLILYRLRDLGAPAYSVPVSVYIDKTAYDSSDSKTKERFNLLKSKPNRKVYLVDKAGSLMYYNTMIIRNADSTKDVYFWTNEELTKEESGGDWMSEKGKNDESALFFWGVQTIISPIETELLNLSAYSTQL